MNLKEAFDMTEDSTNPDYKGKTRPNTALTHINIKNGKPASARKGGAVEQPRKFLTYWNLVTREHKPGKD